MRTWNFVWLVVCGCEQAVECSALDVEACTAEEACAVIEGVPVEVLTTGTAGSCFSQGTTAEPVGCHRRADDCLAVELYAAPSDDLSSVWFISGGCFPLGWEEVPALQTCP